jgi:hypothetical protein
VRHELIERYKSYAASRRGRISARWARRYRGRSERQRRRGGRILNKARSPARLNRESLFRNGTAGNRRAYVPAGSATYVFSGSAGRGEEREREREERRGALSFLML